MLVAVGACLAMTAWRWEVLRLPPWQDQAVGLWAEADFLAETGFDYRRLRYDERHYLDMPSGRRSYMISVLPTLVALLMVNLPSVAVVTFVVHALSLIYAGMIIGFLFYLLQPAVGAVGAVLLCGALVTTPIFITQVELAGMDVPLGLVVLVSLMLLARGHFTWAAVASLAAFFLKASGQLATLTGLTYVILLLAFPLPGVVGVSRRRLLGGGAAFSGVLLCEALLLHFGDTTMSQRLSSSWPPALRWPRAMWNTTPDVLLLMLVAAMWMVFSWVRQSASPANVRGVAARFRALRPAIGRIARDDSLAVVSWILIVGLCASSWLYVYFPRYVFCALPPLLLIWGGLIRHLMPSIWWQPWAGLLIAFNVINADGRFFPDIERAAAFDFSTVPSFTRRSCMVLERSREYLPDHLATIAALNWLSEHAADKPVLIGQPYFFLATRPRLGYVEKPLYACDADSFSNAISAYRELTLRSPAETPLLAWFGQTRVTLPPPEPSEILYDDGQNPPLQFYRRLPPPDALSSRRALEDWYLAETWKANWVNGRMRERLPFLLGTNRYPQAVAEINQAIQWQPIDSSLIQLRDQVLTSQEVTP